MTSCSLPVFSPLGLNLTSLPDGFRLPAPYMHGYDNEGNPPADVSTRTEPSAFWASGGMVSSPIDVNEFARGYVGRKLFGQATQDQQLQLVDGHSEPTGPGSNRAGLGIFRYRTKCGTVYGHTGNFPGYTQFLASTLDGRALGDLLDLGAAQPGHDRPPAHGLQGVASRRGDRRLCSA